MNQNKLPCPSCAQVGKKVELETVRSLAVHPNQVPTDEDIDYQFCISKGCPVVYYSPGRDVPEFKLEDVNVRVGQKRPGAPTPVCYCFSYSEEEITAELKETGVPGIPEKIRAEMKAGNCFCLKSNPSGKCCFGNVQAVVRRFEELEK